MKYYLSPQLDWKTFKKLCDSLSPDSGPTPKHGNRFLHSMLRERSINIFVDTDEPTDPIIISTRVIPKGATMLRGR